MLQERVRDKQTLILICIADSRQHLPDMRSIAIRSKLVSTVQYMFYFPFRVHTNKSESSLFPFSLLNPSTRFHFSLRHPIMWISELEAHSVHGLRMCPQRVVHCNCYGKGTPPCPIDSQQRLICAINHPRYTNNNSAKFHSDKLTDSGSHGEQRHG